ncbi:MAG: polyprenyl synthetase family protein [Bacteroidota bacterium]
MEQIKKYQTTFLAYLANHPFKKEPLGLYEPVDYILNLGGKRMRPIALLMAYQVFKEDWEAALPAAYAIEIFHNFTLVHDDVIDDAPLRRGKMTVHEKWDLNTSILSGDVMLVYAYEYLLALENKVAISSIIKTFNKAAIEVCEGQQQDVDFELKAGVSIAEYLKMIELKTSVLLAAAMKIGALAAGSNESDAEHLYQFGRNIGIAFQLQDDYLDTFGDPAKFGKKVGGDIAKNKKTFLVLKALELADEPVKEELNRWMSNSDKDKETEKINRITAIFHALNIPALTKKMKNGFQDRAFQHLQAVSAEVQRKQALTQLAEMLLDREV